MTVLHSNDKQMILAQRIGIVALVLALAGATGCAFPGQRLLTIQIERDGMTIFSGNYGVPDSTPVDEMYDVVTKVDLDATTASSKTINSQQSNEEPQESLPGQLVLLILHSDEELARRNISNLEMSQISEGKYWRVKEISYSD